MSPARTPLGRLLQRVPAGGQRHSTPIRRTADSELGAAAGGRARGSWLARTHDGARAPRRSRLPLRSESHLRHRVHRSRDLEVSTTPSLRRAPPDPRRARSSSGDSRSTGATASPSPDQKDGFDRRPPARERRPPAPRLAPRVGRLETAWALQEPIGPVAPAAGGVATPGDPAARNSRTASRTGRYSTPSSRRAFSPVARPPAFMTFI